MSFLRKQESRYFLGVLDSRFHGNDTQICYVGPSIEPIIPRLPVFSSRLMGHVQFSKGGRGDYYHLNWVVVLQVSLA